MEEKINKIMEGFDFKSLHHYMTFQKVVWYYPKWEHYETPSIEELKETARRLLADLLKEPKSTSVGTGGLEAYREDGNIGLCFVIKPSRVEETSNAD